MASLVTPSESRRAQAIRDYKLTVEYKHLKQNSPGGIYVVPSFDDLRLWFGVIFVRRGMYANGIFKFRIELPPEYNDENAWPRVFFTSRMYSPLVDPESGELDVRSQYPEWDPAKHYVVTVLTFLKKIFYIKDGFYVQGDAAFNPSAAAAYVNDAPEFLRAVDACVRASNERPALFDDAIERSLRFVDRPDPDGDLDRFRDVLGRAEGPLADEVLRLVADDTAEGASGS